MPQEAAGIQQVDTGVKPGAQMPVPCAMPISADRRQNALLFNEGRLVMLAALDHALNLDQQLVGLYSTGRSGRSVKISGPITRFTGHSGHRVYTLCDPHIIP